MPVFQRAVTPLENTVIQKDNRGTKHRPFPLILNYSFSGESIVTSIYEMEQLLVSLRITRVETFQ